jgi:hypothetical protein
LGTDFLEDMTVAEILIDVAKGPEQRKGSKPRTSTKPDELSVDDDIEQGLEVVHGDGNIIGAWRIVKWPCFLRSQG